jgi:hypothetical protein
LVTAFLEDYLSLIGDGFGKNPPSKRNYLDLKVKTVSVLPKLQFTENLNQKGILPFFEKEKFF